MKRIRKPKKWEIVFAICVFLIIATAVSYYFFVERPCSYKRERLDSNLEYISETVRDAKKRADDVQKMKKELDEIDSEGNNISPMPGFDYGKEELGLLNGILGSTLDYSIKFEGVSEDGDQVRRNFSLQFTESSYQRAMDVISKLERCEVRCIVGDVTCTSESDDILGGTVYVGTSATFFETKHQDKAADEKVNPENGEALPEPGDDAASAGTTGLS